MFSMFSRLKIAASHNKKMHGHITKGSGYYVLSISSTWNTKARNDVKNKSKCVVGENVTSQIS